jgi:hypothetical protein
MIELPSAPTSPRALRMEVIRLRAEVTRLREARHFSCPQSVR